MYVKMRKINCALLSVALFIQLPVVVWLLNELVTHHSSVDRHFREVPGESYPGSDPTEIIKNLLSSTSESRSSSETVKEVLSTDKTTPFNIQNVSTSKPPAEPLFKLQDEYWQGPEQLAEKSGRVPIPLTPFEEAGYNIMFTIRTTPKLHQKRLPILFETWITTINASNFYLVTDGIDMEYKNITRKIGMHYVNISCGSTYSRYSLCCKSGEEMSLMHRPENKHYDWFCHMDDDIYIIYKNIVKLLSLYDPKTEPIYIGRAGTYWPKPKSLNVNQTLIENKHFRFHFAVGGLYCLSRPMLEKVKPWLGNGPKMGETCNKLLEPEDVSLAATVELLAKERLMRTKLFHPHGLILSKMVNPKTLKDQIGFAYGCGQLCGYAGYKHNAVKVPQAKFSYNDDPSRFKSIHCHLFPDAPLCDVT